MFQAARGLVLLVLAGSLASGGERLMWHEVRLDREGKLLSWVETEGPYGRIIRNAWEAFQDIPVQPDGYRTYFTHPTFYGPNDPAHPAFSGRSWVHHPAGLFAMLTDVVFGIFGIAMSLGLLGLAAFAIWKSLIH